MRREKQLRKLDLVGVDFDNKATGWTPDLSFLKGQ
tara:strand:+ start:2119 stop:2223 length:105 start_codon:yes stop_codon:yes gene_type:complete